MAHYNSQTALQRQTRLLTGLGRAVRSRRLELGLTLRELGQRAGVSERFLVQLEAGEGNISVARLHEVALALQSTASALLTLAAKDERAGHPVVSLVGLRGAGKSSVGRFLAERLDIPFCELDAEIAQRAGMTLSTIFEVHGESYFRRLEREALASFLEKNSKGVIATSGSIVTDELTFRMLRERTHVVWLRARPQDHWDRVVAQGDGRPMAGRPRAMAELKALFAARKPLYDQAHRVLKTTGAPIERVAAELGAALADQG